MKLIRCAISTIRYKVKRSNVNNDKNVYLFLLLVAVGMYAYVVTRGDISMCFSSTASFSASALLAATGVVSFTRADNTPKKVLAGIPFIFSIQQFIEGVLWMSLLHPAWHRWEGVATYLFQVFAQVIWPVYIPMSILLFEHDRLRRRLILLLLLCGIILSVCTGYFLYHYPVRALAADHHIRYLPGFPLAQKWYYGMLYFLPTILAPIISSVKNLRWLGYLFLFSYAVARILFHFYEISVWCFFGALVSFTVLLMLSGPLKVTGTTTQA